MKPWRSLSSGERHRNRPGGGNPPGSWTKRNGCGYGSRHRTGQQSARLCHGAGLCWLGCIPQGPLARFLPELRDPRFRSGLQEVQETHGQLEVGALVAVHAIAPPALEEAVYEISHSTVVFARQYVACEEELRAPDVEPLGKLLVQVLQVLEKLLSRIHGNVVVPTNIGATEYLHM
jgi:hypothetical protein